MSMLFDLRRIPLEHLDSLLADPNDIFFFLYGEVPYDPPKSFLRKIFSRRSAPAKARHWEAPTDGKRMELDKNWHVLHFLFCHSPEEGDLPEATLLFGGTQLGEVDVGYGPARALKPTQVDNFLQFLNSLRKDSFGSDVTAKELEENEIYGSYPEWGAEDVANLWEYVEEMKSFLTKAVSDREGVILYIY